MAAMDPIKIAKRYGAALDRVGGFVEMAEQAHRRDFRAVQTTKG